MDNKLQFTYSLFNASQQHEEEEPPDFDASLFWILLCVAVGVSTLLFLFALIFVLAYEFDKSEFEGKQKRKFKLRPTIHMVQAKEEQNPFAKNDG